MSTTRRMGALLVALVTTLALSVGLAPAGVAAKPQHEFKSLQSGETSTEGRFFVKGQVTSYRNRPVILQRQAKKGAPWKTVQRKDSNEWGGFRMYFGGRIGNGFRVKLYATKWRSETYRFIGRIVPAREAAPRLSAR